MGKKVSLIVNYRNSLGLYHIAVEQMTVTTKNYFIRPEDFAAFVAERYIARGCDHVICVEFLRDKITKAGLRTLAEIDTKFLVEKIKDEIGRRWEFTKDSFPESEVKK